MSREKRISGQRLDSKLRETVELKRKWHSPAQSKHAIKGFRGWYERGYLPHRDEPGLTQFVTFRLADSFPVHLRAEWEPMLQIDDERKRRASLEDYLDSGRGECALRRPEIANLVAEGIRRFDRERYELKAWVIMPNHVHVLFKVGEVSMAKIVESWKKHTARKANQLMERRGSFWQADYWDTFIRGEEHGWKTVRYIENNPVKAGLASEPAAWRWSSAYQSARL